MVDNVYVISLREASIRYLKITNDVLGLKI